MAQITRRTVLRAAAGSLAGPMVMRAGTAAAAARAITIVTAGGAPDDAGLASFAARGGPAVRVLRVAGAAALARAVARGEADLAVLPHDAARAMDAAALRPFAAGALPLADLAPGMIELSADWGAGLRWAPAGWRAKGIAWRTDRWSPWGGAPSYADLWDGSRAALGAPRAMLLGAGLHLEQVGALPEGALWAAHDDDALARDVWATVEAWCAPRAACIRKGGAAGLSDGTADAALIDARSAAGAARGGAPLGFAAPAEGAMARLLGLARPAAAPAATLAAATEFAALVMAQDGGMADWSGGEALMGPEALVSLRALPPESPAHAARRRAVAARVFGAKG